MDYDLGYFDMESCRNGPYAIGVPKGIRTPVTAVKGRCPRPLDDGDNIDFGGAKRDRTADLLHAMQALSQLSYSPELAERQILSWIA